MISIDRCKSCRVCGSSALSRVIDLGEQYLQGAFLEPGKPIPLQDKIPMSLVRCRKEAGSDACGLLQAEFTVPPELMYKTYWYRSGTNQTMRDHLAGIAQQALVLSGSNSGRVLDIGCNDGTLLRNFPPEFERVGVDPSDIASSISDEFRVFSTTFPSKEFDDWNGERTFDIVTSIAMFYDLSAPVDFARSVESVLSPEGFWVFEMSYMPRMLELNSYDTICHEHLEYYSLSVIMHILDAAGLRLVRIEQNSINGGSIRCIATKKASHSVSSEDESKEIDRMLAEEERGGFSHSDAPYRDFQKRIEKHAKELIELLSSLRKNGKRIHIYGASTKGNTILQWCGIDNSVIDVAAERNPAKFGARTLGTDIPIVSETESRAANPDFYLVLPWHFQEEFLEREKSQLERGVGFIFPLPELRIVTRNGEREKVRHE